MTRKAIIKEETMSNTLDQIVFEMLNSLRDGDYKDPGDSVKEQILNNVKEVNEKIQKKENVQNDILKTLETVYILDFYARFYPEDSKWIYRLSDEIYEKLFYGVDY